MSLITIQDNISNAFDNNEFSIGIFLDVAKAFDTVDHKILLAKLENIGVRGHVLSWFESYLTNRQQSVTFRGRLSKLKPVKYGVPQGSILGPLLFLLFINDLPNASNLANFILFADDSNVFFTHKSYDALFDMVNLELQKIVEWFKTNLLSLNLTKTNYILFCSHRKKTPLLKGAIHIADYQIPQVTSVKFLGVSLDEHLTWNSHISEVASKTSKNLGIMSRIAYLLPSHIRLTLYYSLIYPYLSYCNMIWASNYTFRLKRLVVIQKRAIRIISGSGYDISSILLFHQFRVLQFEQIKTTQICEFIYKYKVHLLPSIFDNYFNLTSTFHRYEVRSADTYRTIPTRTNSRRFSLKCAGPLAWNGLSPTIRNACSLYSFKKLLRAHLLSNVH